MKTLAPIVVTLPGGRTVTAQVGAHQIRTDQPVAAGGEDSAPSPFDLFLASVGACAGVFVQGFCAARKLPTDEIRLIQRSTFADDGSLTGIDIEVELPTSFPEKYREAIVKVAEQCSVKRAIAAQPRLTVHAASPAERAA